MSVPCSATPSIACVVVSLILVWLNAIGYLASVLLRALEQGPVEERLAHLEATLRKSNAETKSNADEQIFSFRSTTEVLNEQPA